MIGEGKTSYDTGQLMCLARYYDLCMNFLVDACQYNQEYLLGSVKDIFYIYMMELVIL